MRALRSALIAIAGIAGCIHLPPSSRAPTDIWGISSPSAREQPRGGIAAHVDTWIVLDSTSFRPVLAFQPLIASAPEERLSIVTSLQGSRYHPDVVRGIAETGDAPTNTARSVASLVGAGSAGLILDFQEMAPEDLTLLTNVARAIADSARAKGVKQISIIVPAGDTTAYPSATLARIADLLIVRLFPEHGPGTAAGPIVSPPWFARRLGVRAGQVGINRIVAGLPADGILWSSREATRRVSYAEALQLAERASTSFVRDASSGNLHAASARDGWEIWLSDHELIERLIADGRRIGVTRFALFGLDGADPRLSQSLQELVRR